ncbi:ferric reductase-like transmembrane domain-containing protein [Prauserella shujinwangii]|nr:ferric reductase-like transmembrane domain-containing protein [Prauserella shujinwangii]
MLLRVRWGPFVLVSAFVGLAASVLFLAVPASGWLTGLAVLAGAVAYAMMATNLFLAIRRPILEKLFGPLDRVYAAHRVIGTSIVGVLGVHVVLIPIASAVERGESLLDNLSVAIPLGVLGTFLLVGSIMLAHSRKVPYDRWQRVHMATGGAFLVLTLHMVIAASGWFSLASPMGGLLGGFALLGLGSFVVRLVDKARGGARYTVVETLKRERGLEVVLRPEEARGIAPHRAGQFVFLTANDETHPFTVTSAAGVEQLSVLIRSSGDWTDRAQTGLAVADRVRVDGPFGAFTPSVGVDAPPHQVWIAGGAGITPFLSVLRGSPEVSGGQVELVIAARHAGDVPCWDELSTLASTRSWLTLTPAFSARGGRLDDDAVDRLVAGKPEGTEWYLCGPVGLTAMVERRLQHVPDARVHRELYQWRKR